MNAPQYRTNARDPGRRSPKGPGGFTLVEMLAVLAIIGILFGAAIVGVNQLGRGTRLRSGAHLVGQQLELARQLAMTNRAIHGVEFDFDASDDTPIPRLRIFREKDDATIGEWIDMPPGIKFGGAPPPTYDHQMPDEKILFKPTGSTVQEYDAFKVHDRETHKERVVEVVPITGHTKVYIEP